MSENFGKYTRAAFFWVIIAEIFIIILSYIPAESLLENGMKESGMTSNILMSDGSGRGVDGKYYGTVLGSELSRDRIVTVTFLDTLETMTDSAWDVSQSKNGTVMAWTEPNAVERPNLDLFIGAEGKIQAESCFELFRGYYNVKKIEFNDCFDTSQVTDMRAMFQYCENLAQLDLGSLDTSQVTSMEAMFNDCTSLAWLNVSGFDTSQVTNMRGMFCDCSSLAQLDISDFDTSQVTNMQWLFMGCESLTQLDVSNFDTSQVTDMWGMFCDCSSLAQLNISDFDTSQVTDMRGMFNGCKSLVQLDISNFDTSRVKDRGGMFEGCAITAEEANLRR